MDAVIMPIESAAPACEALRNHQGTIIGMRSHNGSPDDCRAIAMMLTKSLAL